MDATGPEEFRSRGTRVSSLVASAARSRPASADGRRPNLAVVLIATVMFGLVLPLLIMGGGGSPLAGLPEILRWVVVLYAAFRLSSIVVAGQPRWLAFAFWMFTYVWMGVAGLLQTTFDENPYGITWTHREEIVSCLVVLAGMIAFDAAYGASGRLPVTSPRSRVISERRVIALFGLTVVAIPPLVAIQGGASSFLVTRYERNDILAEQGLSSSGSSALAVLLTFITLVLPFATFVLTIGCMRQDPLRWRRPAWLAMLVVSGSLALFLGNPIVSSRFWFGTILFSLCFIVSGTRGPRWVRSVMVGLLVMTVFVFPYADYFRAPDQILKTQSAAAFFTEKPDYDAITQMNTVQRYVHERGYTDGKQLLGVIGFAVPRTVWESKAPATGAQLARVASIGLENLSAPLWVEGYIDFGVPGALILLGLTGFACRRGDSAFVRGHSQWVRVFVPAVAAYSFVVYRGSLLGIAPGGFVLVVCCLFAAVKVRRDGSGAADPQDGLAGADVGGDQRTRTHSALVTQRHTP